MSESILIAARDWNWERELLKSAQEVFWGDGKIVCSDQRGCYKTVYQNPLNYTLC